MAALQLIETVEETLLGADMDIMKLADRYVACKFPEKMKVHWI